MPTTVSFGNVQPLNTKPQAKKATNQPLAALTTPQDTVRFGGPHPADPTNATGNIPEVIIEDITDASSPEDVKDVKDLEAPEAAEKPASAKAPTPGASAKTPASAPTPKAAEASNGNWFTKRAKTILPGLGAAFHGGEFHPVNWPFKGWKTDLTQSSIVTLPLTFLPGSQLILIPAWMALGALVRSTLALGKGMFKPDQVLKEIEDKKEKAPAEKAAS